MRYLLLLFSLLASLLVSAQTKEYPFVEEGKTWVILSGLYGDFTDPNEVFTYYYSLRGDTIIVGKVAKKFFCDSTQYGKREMHIRNDYKGAFYEEDNQLYFCEEHSDSFLLLFDCGVKVGDSINITSGDYGNYDFHRYISSLQTVYIDSIRPFDTKSSRKEYLMREDWKDFMVLHESGNEGSYEIVTGGSWVEGIGCVYSAHANPHETWHFLYTGGAIDRMVSCTVGNRVEYLLTGITTPTRESKPTADTYYSIDGRRLTAPPARGVYLHNGRKMVK